MASHELDVKHPIYRTWILALQQSYRHIVNWDSRGGFAIACAIVGMPVQHEIGAVPVDDFGQPRGPEEREDVERFSLNGSCDWRIVEYNNAFLCP